MKKIKMLLLIVFSSFLFATPSYASEETNLGIGFEDATTVVDSSSTPTRQYTLPETSGRSSRRGLLPKTGDHMQSARLRMIGLCCLIICFWLFLVNYFKGEEADE